MNKTGRPVLVGTTSVEQSDSLSTQLKEAGIPHEVFCFKDDFILQMLTKIEAFQ